MSMTTGNLWNEMVSSPRKNKMKEEKIHRHFSSFS